MMDRNEFFLSENELHIECHLKAYNYAHWLQLSQNESFLAIKLTGTKPQTVKPCCHVSAGTGPTVGVILVLLTVLRLVTLTLKHHHFLMFSFQKQIFLQFLDYFTFTLIKIATFHISGEIQKKNQGVKESKLLFEMTNIFSQ